MPSKNYNGQNPLGEKRSQSFAQVELQVGRLQPAISLQSGSLQTPNGRILSQKMRPSTSTAACVPWKPRIVDERIEGAEDPDYKLYLNPGTVNGVINSAWNDLINLPSNYETSMYYILATVSFTEGQVSGIVYSLSATIPSGDLLNPVAKDALPAELTIILGTTFNLTSCMVWTANLNVTSVDIFRESLPTPTGGEQPYKVWYTYQTSAATA